MPTYTASNGDDFVVKQLDRSYKGILSEILKIDGKTGTLTVANLTNSGSLAITGNATVTGTLAVTGATTIGGKTPMTGSCYTAIIAGADASGSVVSTTLSGAVIGDKVIGCINLTGDTDVQTSFETAVTVTGKIQQTATNLTAATKILVILQHL